MNYGAKVAKLFGLCKYFQLKEVKGFDLIRSLL
jgi:hypothetical protein